MATIVTGVAGFIGRFVALRLLDRGETVIGIDNFNTYYDPRLKEARIAELLVHSKFRIIRADVNDTEMLRSELRNSGATRVVHLAAQAGVRYSLENPFAYEHSNVAGHLSVLEACRSSRNLEHLVYASSSSVYGDRHADGAFQEDDAADTPASLYAATKRACELMSTAYGRLYGFPQTGLRFFTVYGPWGRPDMAYFIFSQKILAGEPIEVFGEGRMQRDFTYVDDIVDGVVGALDLPPESGVNRILNIGDNRPVGLLRMIEILEDSLGRRAQTLMRPKQPGDVTSTWADISRLSGLTGYYPKVTLEEGLPRFVRWYCEFYGR